MKKKKTQFQRFANYDIDPFTLFKRAATVPDALLNLPNLLKKAKEKEKTKTGKKKTLTTSSSKTDRSRLTTNRSTKSKYKIKTILNTRKKVRPDNISESSSTESSEVRLENPFKHSFDINEPFICKLTGETRKLYMVFLIYHAAMKFSGVKLKKFMALFLEDTFGNIYLSNVEVYDLELEGEIIEQKKKQFNFKEDINKIVKEFGETAQTGDIFKLTTDRLREDLDVNSVNEL